MLSAAVWDQPGDGSPCYLSVVLGMAFLLRSMNLKEPLVLIGAVLFGLLPAGFARIAGGHFTWVCASAWLPWLLALPYSQQITSRRRIGSIRGCHWIDDAGGFAVRSLRDWYLGLLEHFPGNF